MKFPGQLPGRNFGSIFLTIFPGTNLRTNFPQENSGNFPGHMFQKKFPDTCSGRLFRASYPVRTGGQLFRAMIQGNFPEDVPGQMFLFQAFENGGLGYRIWLLSIYHKCYENHTYHRNNSCAWIKCFSCIGRVLLRVLVVVVAYVGCQPADR